MQGAWAAGRGEGDGRGPGCGDAFPGPRSSTRSSLVHWCGPWSSIRQGTFDGVVAHFVVNHVGIGEPLRLELWHLLIILLIAAGAAVVFLVARVVRRVRSRNPDDGPGTGSAG